MLSHESRGEVIIVSFLNLGSLVLGLIAWTLPVVSLMRTQKNEYKHWVVLSVMSISACAISLCFQIFYSYHLVKIEDWTALLDTTSTVVFMATVLLIVTIILNTINLIVYRKKTVT